MSKESHKYQISKRIFNKQDLIEIATLFHKRAELAMTDGEKPSVRYNLIFSGGSSYERETPDIFSYDEIIDYKKLLEIDISFWSHCDDNLRLGLRLEHGNGCYGNNLYVSGKNTSWVNESFIKLKELIDGCEPQVPWVTKYSKILECFLAVGIGSILTAIFVYFFLYPLTDKLIILLEEKPSIYIFSWVFRWSIGVPPAQGVMRWFSSHWPNIEFDLGPDHLKKEKITRKRVATVATLIVIPIIISIVVEFLLIFM